MENSEQMGANAFESSFQDSLQKTADKNLTICFGF